MIGIVATVLFSMLGFFGLELALQTQKNITVHELLYPHYYQSTFPEDKFPPKKNRQIYHEQVESGYQLMKDKRVVICSLGRNIAHNLEHFKQRIKHTGALFKDYTLLIFENDSKDGSRDLLKIWMSSNPHVKLLELEHAPNGILNLPELYSYGSTSAKRIEKMSYFRNIYLEHVKKYYHDYDYMMVVDMDIKGPWSEQGIAHSLAQNDWDGITSYGLINMFGTAGQMLAMYDVLAYVPYNKDFKTEPSTLDIAQDFLTYNFKELRSVKRGSELIRVRSAFGGIALYKIPSILHAQYVPTRCEHIGFHDTMTHNGHDKIFMNPNLIILAGLQGPPNPFKEIALFKKAKTLPATS